MDKYRLVECPAYTAIEEIATGERLVTIFVKEHNPVTGCWDRLLPKYAEERKQRVLAIFNGSLK